ncbi:hypothetical protein, partial [Streptomyces abikoensis]|uniref:hypothetical protein n=1 Tax=Streptomyces abikoensis TaxID=97398 RepID=UPI0036C38D9C
CGVALSVGVWVRPYGRGDTVLRARARGGPGPPRAARGGAPAAPPGGAAAEPEADENADLDAASDEELFALFDGLE